MINYTYYIMLYFSFVNDKPLIKSFKTIYHILLNYNVQNSTSHILLCDEIIIFCLMMHILNRHNIILLEHTSMCIILFTKKVISNLHYNVPQYSKNINVILG